MSVEVLHGRLGPVTSAFTAVKGGHGGDGEGWPLLVPIPEYSLEMMSSIV